MGYMSGNANMAEKVWAKTLYYGTFLVKKNILKHVKLDKWLQFPSVTTPLYLQLNPSESFEARSPQQRDRREALQGREPTPTLLE